MSYIGNTPFTAAFLTDTFSGNGTTVAFTMSVAPANTSSILVAVTGVVQDPSTYSVSGTTLTFSAAPPSGTSNISVRYLGIPASGVTTTAYRTQTEFTATAGQTTFTVPSYTVGYIDVYRNGLLLGSSDFTATTGTTVVLAAAASAGDFIETVSFYVSSVLNAIQQYNGLSVNQVLTTPTANTLTSASGSNLQLQTNGGTTAVTFDTAQNMGLGVTPSAWSNYKALQFGGGSVSSYEDNNYIELAQNSFYAAGAYKYVNSGFASKYQQNGGTHQWYRAASGTAGGTISFTQAMTLDSSGNLGVGTTSPSGRLHVEWSASNATAGMYLRNTSNGSNAYAGVYIGNDSSATDAFIGSLGSANTAYGGARSLLIGTNPSAPVVFMTAATERARIDSSGRLLVGGTGLVGQIGVTCTDNSINAIAMTHSGATAGVLNVKASDASYTSNVIEAFSTRANNSAFALLKLYTSGGSDTEFNLRGDGNGYADGTWNNNGADYAEYFESTNGLALTVGATVVLEGNKVREATSQDAASAVMGVVRPKEPSKASMVIGNTAWNKWADKYLTDDFDRYIMEDHDVVEWTDEEGRQHSYESHNIPDGIAVPDNAVRSTHDDNGNKFQHYKLNPAWNPDVEYVNRENRAEWNIIGLLGQVKILKGQPVGDRWVKMRDVSDSVEEWMIR